MSELLKNRRGLVLGIANQRSIAYGIARTLHQAGAELALGYQSERLEKRILPIAEELDAKLVEICDLTVPEHLKGLAKRIEKTWGQLDFIIHAVAFAEKDDLKGRLIETSRDGFLKAMEVSVFSLLNLLKHMNPLLEKGHCPSVVTLTYEGSRRIIPNYNVMGLAKAALESSVRYLSNDLGTHGVRVNALSPGPIKTLSAAGISGFSGILKHVERDAPLKRNVTIDDVGNAALWLVSDLAGAVTGEVIHVDAGINNIGLGTVAS